MITLCIVTHDNPGTLAPCLLCSLMQDYIRITDVFVLDNGDIPASGFFYEHVTALFAEKNIGFLKIRNNQLGISEARETLLNKVKTPYILFLDDDVCMEPFALIGLWNAMSHYKVGYVLGQLREPVPYRGNESPFSSEAWVKRYNDSSTYIEGFIHHVSLCSGGFVLYDTEKLKSVGGFSHLVDYKKDRQGGEDMITQLLLLEKHGGLLTMESLAYHIIPPEGRRFNSELFWGGAAYAGEKGGALKKLFTEESITTLSRRYYEERQSKV